MAESDVLDADRRFFQSLLAADAKELDRILADDFVMIDVLTGSEVEKPLLVDVVASGRLRFEKIVPVDSRVRLHDGTAVITGRTELSGHFGEAHFAANSRYTHVFIQQQGRWQLLAAQGTRITEP